MATPVNTDQLLPFVIAPLKADGSPGQVQAGSVVYATSDATVLTVSDLSADQLSGNVTPVAAGTARVTVTADADIGTGVVTITGVSDDVDVTIGPSSMATTFSFTFGAPVPKTPVTPPGP